MAEVSRHEVLMTGVGGKGVLTAGLLLAQAAMEHYSHVVWFPSYQAAMRGGPCECTVIISQEEIASPVLTQAGCLVVMEPSQLRPFEKRLLPGGLLIAEAAGLDPQAITRRDVRSVLIPAVQTAVELGHPQASNFVLLGAYLVLSGALPVAAVAEVMQRR